MRVLVIEDDADVTLLYRFALEDAGHEVTAAALGRDGVRRAAEDRPDVIVLDRMLPDIDGLAVLDALGAEPSTASIPVVMASARVGGADQRAALDRGAAAYVIKPFDPIHIADVVAQVGRSGTSTGDEEPDATERRRNDETRDAFLHAVSHELRSPITAVIGFSSLLTDRYAASMPPEAVELSRRIRASASKLDRLLGDLLDLDRLERGVLEAQRRDIEVLEVIQQCLDTVNLEGRRLTVSVGPDLRAHVDGAQLERIVEHLLVNAVRHTPATASVEIRVTPSANGILLVVEDDGPGIPLEVREQIFEPFRRDAAGGTAGTGIGLSLVARFAELHDGRAWVEERTGGGASFRVALAI